MMELLRGFPWAICSAIVYLLVAGMTANYIMISAAHLSALKKVGWIFFAGPAIAAISPLFAVVTTPMIIERMINKSAERR